MRLVARQVFLIPPRAVGKNRSTVATLIRLLGLPPSIRKLVEEGKTVVIYHEEIPGYMQAMAMPFQVKDPSLLEGVKPGDQVHFSYIVTQEKSWIESMEKTRDAEP